MSEAKSKKLMIQNKQRRKKVNKRRKRKTKERKEEMTSDKSRASRVIGKGGGGRGEAEGGDDLGGKRATALL